MRDYTRTRHAYHNIYTITESVFSKPFTCEAADLLYVLRYEKSGSRLQFSSIQLVSVSEITGSGEQMQPRLGTPLIYMTRVQLILAVVSRAVRRSGIEWTGYGLIG